MCLLSFLYIIFLFFVFVPGVFISIPSKGSKMLVAGVHALIFGIIFHFSNRIIHRVGISLEGFTEEPTEEETKEDTEEQSGEQQKEQKKQTEEESIKKMN